MNRLVLSAVVGALTAAVAAGIYILHQVIGDVIYYAVALGLLAFVIVYFADWLTELAAKRGE